MNDDQIKELVQDTETRLLERIEKVETTLLREFQKWAVQIRAAMRTTSANQIGLGQSNWLQRAPRGSRGASEQFGGRGQ